jgi:hypothetical protein
LDSLFEMKRLSTIKLYNSLRYTTLFFSFLALDTLVCHYMYFFKKTIV